MNISFIIVAFNSEQIIEDCITSILRFSNLNSTEIIVIDNSPDEKKVLTKLICNKYNNYVKYITNSNKGYGQGNNVGIKNAKGDIICVINPDVRFVEPFFEVVEDNFNKYDIALLALKQIGGSSLSYYLKPEYTLPLINRAIIKFSNKLDIFISKYFFLSGACFFISKVKFENIGCFDENIFMFNEEADISNRLLQKKYKIKFLNKIKYLHVVGDRKSTNSYLFKYEIDSLEYYLNKYKLNTKFYFLLKKIDLFFISKSKYKLFKGYILKKT